MIAAIILAAGKSRRLAKDINTKKQFLKMGESPLFMESIKKFLDIKNINHIILVIDEEDKYNDNINYFKNSDIYKNNKSKIFITYGGENRYDSVRNSFIYIDRNLCYSDNDKILIHDSARPFVKADDIERVIDALDIKYSVSLGGKCVNTLKRVSSSEESDGLKKITKTENRNEFYEVYTPQGFIYGTIKKAYDKLFADTDDNRKLITDDLQVIEKYLGEVTYLIDSDRHNIKITTKDDLIYL